MSEIKQYLKISKLQVTNFRNLDSAIIEFSPNINCVFGNNGNGKTNLLEAVYYFIHKKSFKKNTNISQILSMDTSEAEVRFSGLFVDNEGQTISHSGKIFSKEQYWFTNNISTKKKLPVSTVFINPFDSFQFHAQASFRREWFDQYIAALNPEYGKLLRKYQQSLKFRNALLSKKPAQYKAQLEAIDLEFVKQAEYITQSRLDFINKLQEEYPKIFQKIFSERHEIKIGLDTKLIPPYTQSFAKILQENEKRDDILGATSYGVHRDDYEFKFDGVDALDYCSLGQQKMSYLSLLFAYMELFRYKFMAYPIVLIDDVSGELDTSRWQRLIDYLQEKDFQVLISTANEKFREELERIDETKASKLQVIQGAVKKL